jgi:outer membrane immunogenic protein
MASLKKCFSAAAAVFVLAGIAHAETPVPQSVHSEFSGPYAGIKLGANLSNASGVVNAGTHGTAFPGLTAGYGFDVGRFVLGGEAFADFHNGSTTRKDGGIDFRAGMPFNKIMPYARIGFTGFWPDTRLHYGLGVEYKLYKNIHLAGEWTTDQSNSDGTKRRNNSFTLGLNYYF